MVNPVAIGAYISFLRRQRGLTQRELASRLGVSTQAVSKWENADNLPDAGILLPLAEALHTSTDALLSAGARRLRQPIDMSMLHAGVAALNTVLAAFGEASPIWRSVQQGLTSLGASLENAAGRELLLTEAILQHLMEGATIGDQAIDITIQDESLRARIRKCRRDCALFADKQQYYDDFRPGYPAGAVEMIQSRIGSDAVIADVGSGTGKLAMLLSHTAARLYAIEPSIHMRRVLQARTADVPQVEVIAATAEATRLPDHSVDAITVAEAYHWFDNEQTRREFRRILKPGGHVFLLWNRFVRNAFYDEMLAVQQEYSTSPSPRQRTRSERADALIGSGKWERFTFDNPLQQTFEQFYGGMRSASYAPEAGTIAGKAYREAVQALFNRYAVHGASLPMWKRSASPGSFVRIPIREKLHNPGRNLLLPRRIANTEAICPPMPQHTGGRFLRRIVSC